MDIFLDSVNIDEIKKYSSYGIISGITTNPSLMITSDSDFYKTVKDICGATDKDVSIEVVATNYEGMIEEGNKIIDVASNVAVKLPTTWEGLRACRYFVDKGRKVNMTLCFSLSQAIMVAKFGATYVSPFIGRLEDNGKDGVGLIADIRSVFDNYGYQTKILAASIRSVDHVAEAALCGADIVTLPAKILSQLPNNDLTDQGMEKFVSDWKKSGMKI